MSEFDNMPWMPGVYGGAYESKRYNKWDSASDGEPATFQNAGPKYGGGIVENIVQTMASKMVVPWILTDGRYHACRRMMTLEEAQAAQEVTNAATGGGWEWVADTEGLYDHVTEMY